MINLQFIAIYRRNYNRGWFTLLVAYCSRLYHNLVHSLALLDHVPVQEAHLPDPFDEGPGPVVFRPRPDHGEQGFPTHFLLFELELVEAVQLLDVGDLHFDEGASDAVSDLVFSQSTLFQEAQLMAAVICLRWGDDMGNWE